MDSVDITSHKKQAEVQALACHLYELKLELLKM
jgi:hypothetical protein